jgi:hypothetical protein
MNLISLQPSAISEQDSKTFLNEIPTSFTDAFSSSVASSFWENPFFGLTKEYSRMNQAELDPTIISQDELNKKYTPLGLTFYRDEKKGYVDKLVEQKIEDLKRGDVIARGPQGVAAKTSYFLGGIAASLADPINLGAAFIPIVGEEQFLSSLATKSLTGARFSRGLQEGFVGNLAVEPINIINSNLDQREHTVGDSLRNITFGTVVSGGLHVTFGKIGDAYKSVTGKENIYTRISEADPALREDIIKYSIGRLAQGKTIDINNLLDRTIIAHEDNIKASADALPKTQAIINLENTKQSILNEATTINPTSVANGEIKSNIIIDQSPVSIKEKESLILQRDNLIAELKKEQLSSPKTTFEKIKKMNTITDLQNLIKETEYKISTKEKPSSVLNELKTKLNIINRLIDNEKLRIGLKNYEEKIAPKFEAIKITTEPKNINDKASQKISENFEITTPLDNRTINADDINVLNSESKTLKEQSIIEDKAINDFNKSAKDYADVINNEINTLDKKIDRQSDLLTSIKSGLSCIIRKGL